MCRCSKKKVINDDLKDTMRVVINDDLKVNWCIWKESKKKVVNDDLKKTAFLSIHYLSINFFLSWKEIANLYLCKIINLCMIIFFYGQCFYQL